MCVATRHFLGIETLPVNELTALLDATDKWFRAPASAPTQLRGHAVINLFLEPSTRTRTSFELAAKRLGAEVVNIEVATSSASKGETLLDTTRNLDAMRPSAIVVRHANAGAPLFMSQHVRCAVINAGDGSHEHPSQAILDVATMRAHKGKLAGLTVAIVGDIQHSRVARSNIHALAKLGASIRVCAPQTLLPRGIERIGGDVTASRVTTFTKLQPALDGADVVMMLRVQAERMKGEASRFPSNQEYAEQWGLTPRTLAYAKPDAIVMHPGPMNRGVEIASSVADGPRSVILEQVERGVAARMAILDWLLS